MSDTSKTVQCAGCGKPIKRKAPALPYSYWLTQGGLGGAVKILAWTGGNTPPARYNEPAYRFMRSMLFREQLQECGGLDLWKCAGTSALERARIFWNRAKLDAWRTINP